MCWIKRALESALERRRAAFLVVVVVVVEEVGFGISILFFAGEEPHFLAAVLQGHGSTTRRSWRRDPSLCEASCDSRCFSKTTTQLKGEGIGSHS